MIGRALPLAVLAFLLSVAPARAQFRIEARFDRNEAYVGESLRLEVSVIAQAARIPRGRQELPRDLRRYFAVEGTGSSYQTSIRNGVSRVRQTTTYQLRAIRPGNLRLGPVQMTLSGKTYQSQPLAITVRPAPTGSQPGGQAPPYFAELRVQPEGPFYPGQEVRAALVIFALAPIVRWGLVGGTLPDMPKLHQEVLDASREIQLSTVERDGHEYYQGVVLQLALYPLVSGPVSIPAFAFQLQLSGTSGRAGGGGLDPFFDSFFRTLRGTTVEARTDERVLEVLPLPEQGRPAGFGGAVGEVSVTGQLDRGQVEVGGVIGYTLEIMLRGDPEGLLPPPLHLPADYDSFDTQVSLTPLPTPDGGIQYRKRFSYLIVPRRPGLEQFSPVDLVWFDPLKRAYRQWRSPKVSLNVTGEAAPGLTGSPGTTGQHPSGELAQAELRYIKPDASSLRLDAPWPHRRVGFYALLLVPLGLFALALAQARRMARIREDWAWARRQGASRAFRGKLAAIETPADGTDRLGLASQALLELIGDLWNFEAAGLTHRQLETRLLEQGVAPETSRRVRAFLAEADEARFAGTPTGAAAKALVERLGALAEALQEARA